MNARVCANLLAEALDHQAQGRLSDAERVCRTILAAQPGNATAAHLLAVVWCQAGCLAEGEGMLRRLLAVRPDDPEILRHLLDALFGQRKLAESVTVGQRLLALTPGDAAVHVRLGESFQALGRAAEAEAAYGRAVALAPTVPESHLGLGALLFEQDRHAEAAEAFQRALRWRPDWPPLLVNTGVALERVAGREDEAIALYRRAIARRPDYPLAHYNLGVALLRQGQYREGWREYGWRWRGAVPELQERAFTQPRWDGAPLNGATVLLHCDEGFGDTIQFARFAALAARRGGRVVLEVAPSLVRLLRRLPGIHEVAARGEPLPPFDLRLNLLDLPGVLELSECDFAGGTPYLAPDPQDMRRWRERLGDKGMMPRVGLVWSGNPTHRADRQRSVALEMVLSRLSGLPVRLYGVQKDVRPTDAEVLAAAGPSFINLGAELRDFADTAALLSQLDLLISVDTATAHLAGALGRPVWMLLASHADWRWQSGRQDTPWYSGMRLFRQTAPGDWGGVLARLEQALAGFG